MWEEQNDVMYHFSTERKNWEAAEAECRKLNSKLAVITSQDESNYIRTKTGE